MTSPPNTQIPACAELAQDLSIDQIPWYCRDSFQWISRTARLRIASFMGFFKSVVGYLAPLFIITAPITSYADQIYAIHRSRTSAGFSLDIPLIMLVASILKLFYWLYARFALSLLLQAIIMIVIQALLLHVALQHRPLSMPHKPFAAHAPSAPAPRPYNFWQWRQRRPYWMFLMYFSGMLCMLQILIGTSSTLYSELLGWVALIVEATLPLPQIMANHRRKGCRGFRLSVLLNWLVGDTFKLTYFFFAAGKGGGEDGTEDAVPWAFKACALFQASCDAYLGVQYWMYGNGPEEFGHGHPHSHGHGKDMEKLGL